MKYVKRHRTALILFLLTGLFVFCSMITECDWVKFWNRRAYLSDIILDMFPPEWSYASEVIVPILATIQMSVVGTISGSAAALLLAPVCAENMNQHHVIRRVIRSFAQILRSFPALILALFFTFLTGLGTFAGSAALAVYTFAIMTRLTYEDIEHASLRAGAALRNMGCHPIPVYLRSVIPEIASSYLSNVLYLMETNVRHSAILGYVGAGGIGILLNETVSWRDYSRTGMVLILLFITVAVMELISSMLTQIINGRRLIGKTQKKIVVIAAVLAAAVSFLLQDGPDIAHTNPAVISAMIGGLIHPDMTMICDFSKSGLLYLLGETICISFAGTILGAVIAVLLAFLGSGRLMPRVACTLVRALILLLRSVPFLIYGLIFIRNTGPGAFAGVLTLAICSVGLLTKRFQEGIDAMDLGAYQALKQMGAVWPLRIRYAILPQIGKLFARAVLYRFDVNIREASVLGMVGAGGIGATLIFSMNHYHWNQAGAIAIGLIIMAWVIDLLSGKLGARKRRGQE